MIGSLGELANRLVELRVERVVMEATRLAQLHPRGPRRAQAAFEQFDDVLAKVDSPSTVINFGTGDGVTVRELVSAFPCARPVPGQRTPSARSANVDKAREVLGWSSKLTIEDGIDSALAWARRRKEVLGYE